MQSASLGAPLRAALRLRRALQISQDGLKLHPVKKNKAYHDHRANQENLVGGRGHDALARLKQWASVTY